MSDDRRPTRWTPDLVVAAMREFEREHGRPLRSNDVAGQASPPGMPSSESIRRQFGTFREACVVAYGEGLERGGAWMRKDDDTERVMFALKQGQTLTELAATRGVSGQALGRRVNRYQAAYGLPVVKRKPGKPRRTVSAKP